MARSDAWSELEDQMVACYWPKFGVNWVGWKEVLPTRTLRAISTRAQRIGVKAHHRGPKPTKWKRKGSPKGDARHYKTDVEPEADPHELRVLKMLASGMTLNEIDRAMRWHPSTAKRIMVERWKRDKDRRHGDSN